MLYLENYIDPKVLQILLRLPDDKLPPAYEGYQAQLVQINIDTIKDFLARKGIDEQKINAYIEESKGVVELLTKDTGEAGPTEADEKILTLTDDLVSQKYSDVESLLVTQEFYDELGKNIDVLNGQLYDMSAKELTQPEKDSLNTYLDEVEKDQNDMLGQIRIAYQQLNSEVINGLMGQALAGGPQQGASSPVAPQPQAIPPIHTYPN